MSGAGLATGWSMSLIVKTQVQTSALPRRAGTAHWETCPCFNYREVRNQQAAEMHPQLLKGYQQDKTGLQGQRWQIEKLNFAQKACFVCRLLLVQYIPIFNVTLSAEQWQQFPSTGVQLHVFFFVCLITDHLVPPHWIYLNRQRNERRPPRS